MFYILTTSTSTTISQQADIIKTRNTPIVVTVISVILGAGLTMLSILFQRQITRSGRVDIDVISDRSIGTQGQKVASAHAFLVDVFNYRDIPAFISRIKYTSKDGKTSIVNRVIAKDGGNNYTQDPINIDSNSSKRIVLDAGTKIVGGFITLQLSGETKKIVLEDIEYN